MKATHFDRLPIWTKIRLILSTYDPFDPTRELRALAALALQAEKEERAQQR